MATIPTPVYLNPEFDTYETINYLAALKILTGDEYFDFFEVVEDYKLPRVSFRGEKCAVLGMQVDGNIEDWSTLRLLLVVNDVLDGDKENGVYSADDINHDEAFELLSFVYFITDDGDYENLGEFLGHEVS